MRKFDGKSYIEEPVTCIKKKYRLFSLPQYLIIQVKRFTKNEFFMEKNPTIVNFPIKNLDLSEFVWDKKNTAVQTEKEAFKYDLLANIIHDGKPENGTYRI